jgi:dihydrofolate reductase
MQVTLDGFVCGPNDELDWLQVDNEDSWTDMFGGLRSVDTYLLGTGMYPGYAQYWQQVLKDPKADPNELAYAKLAEKTDHVVFSKSISKPLWENTRIVRTSPAEEIARLKKQSGKDMMLYGGASLASTFIREKLLDEIILVVNPIILGKGKTLFDNLEQRQSLKLVRSKILAGKLVVLHYRAE